eukprot:3441302-Heterocapsa_arctica.AAC.1
MEGRKSDLDDLGPVSTEKEETSRTGAHRSTRTLVPRASDESTIVPENSDTASDSEWEGARDDVLDVPVAEPATEEPVKQEPTCEEKIDKMIEDLYWKLVGVASDEEIDQKIADI